MNIDEKLSVANGKNPASIINLTNDQRKAYNELIKFIDSPYNENDYKRALIGAAGVGKTYLIKALLKNCNLSYSTIGLSAPSHKACRVLRDNIVGIPCSVNTVQSDFGLRLNFDIDKFDINNPPFDPKGHVKVDAYYLYIIDEASMINRDLLRFIEKYLKKAKCKIIYCGDDHQLSPINECRSEAFSGCKSYKLTQIVRQDDDNPIRLLLDMLRYDIDHKSFTFLNYIATHRESFDEGHTKGFKVMFSNEFQQEVEKQFNDEQITKNTDFIRIVAYTNKAVGNWNKFVRNTIIKDAFKSIITKNDLFTSYVTIVDKFNDPIIRNSEDYIVHDVVNYLHPDYKIKGFMVKFQAIHGGAITSPLFILDHTDQFSLQMYCKLSEQMIQDARNAPDYKRAGKWKKYYEFKESCLLLINIAKPDGTIVYSRDLDYGFSITSHKSQGSTYDTVMVDVNDIVYDKHGNPYTNAVDINKRLYVACSRCRNKLFIRYGA